MALNVETGSGSASSESYASVVDATTFHANFGNTAWAALATDALREQALRRATAYMIQVYRERWKGFRLLATTQALDWPRESVYLDQMGFKTYVPSNSIPVEIKSACCEFALRASAGALNPDVERQTSSESIGSLSVTYAPGAPQNTTFNSVDMMLRPFLKNGGNGIQIIRA